MSGNYDVLVGRLNLDGEQLDVLTGLYQAVGREVSDMLEGCDVFASDFEVFDIVGSAVVSVLDDFRASAEYTVLKDVLVRDYDNVVEFLKDGYGSAEEVFADYREIVGG